MGNIKSRYTKKDVFKISIIMTIMIILIIILTFIILETNLLEPKKDDTATNYISFNNSNATDMLKVSNLKRMSNEKGISDKNESITKFEVTGDKDSIYQIVLYHIGNSIDEEFIHFCLEDTNELDNNILSEMTENNSGGRIIYEGIIDGKKEFELKMWIDKEYEDDINNISYEIKIKSK